MFLRYSKKLDVIALMICFLCTFADAMKKKISLLVPVYNESGNLPRLKDALDSLADSLGQYDWEFLFVNDGSADDSLAVLRDMRSRDARVSVVNLSRNFGKENALLAGMDYAAGDAVVIMDADMQHPVEAIPEMLAWWEQGYEDVYGRRRSRGRESWLRKRLSLAYYSMLQGTTRIEVLQNVGDFRLLDRRVVRAICSLRETQRYTKGLYCWVGYNKKEVLFDQADRVEGKSSFNLRSLLNLAIEGITCYTTAPLRIASVAGLLVSLCAFIYLIFVIFKTLIYGESVQGFPTLLCVILLLGGLQLMAIGIIGEYIGRIFSETKQRPPYIVESYNEEKL